MVRTFVLLLGAFLCAWPAAAEDQRLVEIRVHGNYHTPDADIIEIAALTIGQAIGPSTVQDARTRLERSGRFVAVDVRIRYKSLEVPGDIALVIMVQEHPASETGLEVVPAPVRPLKWALRSSMFMPIVSYVDGYGLTYGARVSFVSGLGKGGRLSVPLTWGATKRAAGEFEKPIRNAPIDRIAASVSISQQTNPHYDADVDRREAHVVASRQFGPVRAAGHAGLSGVSFRGVDTRLATYGADLTLDTRADPVFPRNAVFAVFGWDRLGVDGAGINRVRLDTRGYAGLVGQTVLSVRAHFARADAPLPAFERYLLGGAETLRGYRAGTFAGDTIAGGSIELRVPISSPLSFGHAGFDLFSDAGTAIEHGLSLRDARFHSGYGGGVFFLASIFQIKVDVARQSGGDIRVHVMSGLTF